MKYDKEDLTKSIEKQLKTGMSEKDILNRLAEAGLEPIDARLLYIKAKHNVGGKMTRTLLVALRTLLVAFLAFALLGGGIALLFSGFSERNEGLESEHWPATEGVIMRSWITSEVDYIGYWLQPVRSYDLNMIYTYEVNGVPYQGNRILFLDRGHTDRSVIEQRQGKYPVGKYVTVFYDPDNSSDAVLEMGFDKSRVNTLFVVGALLALSGLALWFRMLRRWKRRSNR